MDAKKEELSRMALFHNSTGLGTSSLPQSEAELRDLASRSSAALHALSFMSPMGGPFGLGSANQLTGNSSSFHSPSIHQAIYAGSGEILICVQQKNMRVLPKKNFDYRFVFFSLASRFNVE